MLFQYHPGPRSSYRLISSNENGTVLPKGGGSWMIGVSALSGAVRSTTSMALRRSPAMSASSTAMPETSCRSTVPQTHAVPQTHERTIYSLPESDLAGKGECLGCLRLDLYSSPQDGIQEVDHGVGGRRGCRGDRGRQRHRRGTGPQVRRRGRQGRGQRRERRDGGGRGAIGRRIERRDRGPRDCRRRFGRGRGGAD